MHDEAYQPISGLSWTPEQSTRELPPDIRAAFQEEAAWLSQELENCYLKTELQPASYQKFDGHMIRVAVNRNPVWYRELYAERPYLKRQRLWRALDHIAAETDAPHTEQPPGCVSAAFQYCTLGRTMIRDRLVHGYEQPISHLPKKPEDTVFIPPRNAVRQFFEQEPMPREESYEHWTHYYCDEDTLSSIETLTVAVPSEWEDVPF